MATDQEVLQNTITETQLRINEAVKSGDFELLDRLNRTLTAAKQSLAELNSTNEGIATMSWDLGGPCCEPFTRG